MSKIQGLWRSSSQILGLKRLLNNELETNVEIMHHRNLIFYVKNTIYKLKDFQ